MPFIMQARSSESGEMVTWVSDDPDWEGGAFPGPGAPEEIAATLGPQTTGGGGGGGGSAPGSPGQVIVNDSGAFGATPLLTVSGGDVNVGDGDGGIDLEAGLNGITANSASFLFATAEQAINLTSNSNSITLEADGGAVLLAASGQVDLQPQGPIDYLAVGSGTGIRREWTKKRLTTNATQQDLAHLAEIDSINGTYNMLSVVCEIMVSHPSGGGLLRFEALFAGTTGVWARVGSVLDKSDAGMWTGTAVGGVDIVVESSNNIKVKATGIASTNVAWTARIQALVSIAN